MRRKEEEEFLEINKWQLYQKQEAQRVSRIVAKYGYHLEDTQVHIGGERALMTKSKLVLTGHRDTDNQKVIIKSSRSQQGVAQILQERKCRDALRTINKSPSCSAEYLFPEELLFIHDNGLAISFVSFITPSKTFKDLSLNEKLEISISSFGSEQRSGQLSGLFDGSTCSAFGVSTEENYLSGFDVFLNTNSANASATKQVARCLVGARKFLRENQLGLQELCGYLVHTDLVPHNFFIVDGKVYFIDLDSFRFANKYEGWARFLNYMMAYDQPLEATISDYLRSRGKEEYQNLRAMRVFKLGFLLNYYLGILGRTEGSLRQLTELRINFWREALEAVLSNSAIVATDVAKFLALQEALRSDHERLRQKAIGNG